MKTNMPPRAPAFIGPEITDEVLVKVGDNPRQKRMLFTTALYSMAQYMIQEQEFEVVNFNQEHIASLKGDVFRATPAVIAAVTEIEPLLRAYAVAVQNSTYNLAYKNFTEKSAAGQGSGTPAKA